jgi:competence protein ComEC
MKRWPLRKAYFWEIAPFFRVLLPFTAGIVLYDLQRHHTIAPGIFLAALLLSFLLYFVFSLFVKRQQHDHYNVISLSFLCLTLLLAGYSIAFFSDIRNDKNWFGNRLSDTAVARITDEPAEKAHTWKLSVTILHTMGSNTVRPATGKAFVYVYKDMPMLLHKGDTVLLPSKWVAIKNAGNPYEFDYADYCRKNNIFYQQTCAEKDIRLYSAADDDHAPILEKSHDWCMQQIDRFVPDRTTKGLLQAMLLGDEINLDEDLLHSYSETGIVHIIAISGGNVAIFFIVISWLLFWLKNKKQHWIRYAIALPLVWFYVMMAGAQPSAIRAAIMFSLLAFGIMLQKNNNSLNQLFATAFLLLCAQPFWLFSVGFQLSFVAVLSLILFYKHIYTWLSPQNKIASALWSTVVASISAEILVAPLVVYYFHTFPLLFIVSNVLAYLFMGAVLVLSIAIIVLSFLPQVAAVIGTATIYLVTWFDKMVMWLQQCNPQSFHFLTLNSAELILLYLVIGATALFLMGKKKRMLFSGLAAVCLLLCSFCRDQWIALRQEHFVVYHTGKGNYAEIIRGKRFIPLFADTTDSRTLYATTAAHTELQAWKRDTAENSDLFLVNGKSILLLNNDIGDRISRHVDYVVINYSSGIDPEKLKNSFSPEKLILAAYLPQKQAEKLKADCVDNHITLYLVSEDGAFVQ